MKLFYCIILTLLAASASAQDFSPIVSEVIANNPELNSQRAAQRAEILTRVADNRLEPTEVGFGYKWQSLKGGETKLDFEISQSFDWPGVYGARRKAARRAEAALAAQVASTENALALTATLTACKVVDANLRCDMLNRIVNNLDSLHGSMHTMLEQRQITELDHRKVALEEVSMKQQLADAEAARTAALAELAALNGGTLPAGAADLREYPTRQLRPLEEYLAKEAPEIAALNEQAATTRLDAKVEKMGLAPGFSLGYLFEREGPDYFHGFSVGLKLPSYSAKPRAEAANWQARALELMAEKASTDRRTQLTADHTAALRAEKLLNDYSDAFGKEYPELLRRALDGGQISYIEYFSELNFYLTARLDYLSQLLTYHTLLSTIERR